VRDPVTRLLDVFLTHCRPRNLATAAAAAVAAFSGAALGGATRGAVNGASGGAQALTIEEAEEEARRVAGLDWETCHPPARHTTTPGPGGNEGGGGGNLAAGFAGVVSSVTAADLDATSSASSSSSLFSDTDTKGDTLESLVGRMEAALQPMSDPKLRPQTDQCVLRFAR